MGLFPASSTAPAKVNIRENISGDSYAARVYWEVPRLVPENMRDLTQHGSARQYTGSLVVRGIISSDEKVYAIIGKGIAEIGDEILGAKVANITPAYVEFEMNGKKWKQKVEGKN